MKNPAERTEPGKSRSVYSGNRVVLKPEKSVTHENCAELAGSIAAAVQQDKTQVILDCKNVELLDSAALELLLQVHYELKTRMGTLKLIHVNALCQDILATTRVNNVLLIFKDIHEAIRNIS